MQQATYSFEPQSQAISVGNVSHQNHRSYQQQQQRQQYNSASSSSISHPLSHTPINNGGFAVKTTTRNGSEKTYADNRDTSRSSNTGGFAHEKEKNEFSSIPIPLSPPSINYSTYISRNEPDRRDDFGNQPYWNINEDNSATNSYQGQYNQSGNPSCDPPPVCTTQGALKNRFSVLRSSVSSWCSYYSTLILPPSREWNTRNNVQTLLMIEVTKAIYSSIISISIFALVAIVGIGKIYVDGFDEYSSYFTNWAWTLHGIYYLLAVVGHVLWPAALRFSIYAFTMTVNGVSWSVLLIVFVIIYNNPDLMLDMMSGMGGDTPAGLVLVMNCVFHPLAIILFLVFVISHRGDISNTFYDSKKALLIWLKRTELNQTKRTPRKNVIDNITIATTTSITDSDGGNTTLSEIGKSFAWLSILVDLWIVYSPMVMLGIYMMFNDPAEVYGYPVMGPETGLCVFMICTFFNGVPYLIMSYSPRIKEPDPCVMCGIGHPTESINVDFISLPQVILRMDVPVNNVYGHSKDGINIAPYITTDDSADRIRIGSSLADHNGNNGGIYHHSSASYQTRNDDRHYNNYHDAQCYRTESRYNNIITPRGNNLVTNASSASTTPTQLLNTITSYTPSLLSSSFIVRPPKEFSRKDA